MPGVGQGPLELSKLGPCGEPAQQAGLFCLTRCPQKLPACSCRGRGPGGLGSSTLSRCLRTEAPPYRTLAPSDAAAPRRSGGHGSGPVGHPPLGPTWAVAPSRHWAPGPRRGLSQHCSGPLPGLFWAEDFLIHLNAVGQAGRWASRHTGSAGRGPLLEQEALEPLHPEAAGGDPKVQSRPLPVLCPRLAPPRLRGSLPGRWAALPPCPQLPRRPGSIMEGLLPPSPQDLLQQLQVPGTPGALPRVAGHLPCWASVTGAWAGHSQGPFLPDPLDWGHGQPPGPTPGPESQGAAPGKPGEKPSTECPLGPPWPQACTHRLSPGASTLHQAGGAGVPPLLARLAPRSRLGQLRPGCGALCFLLSGSSSEEVE